MAATKNTRLKKPHGISSYNARIERTNFLFVAPSLLLLLVFLIVPIMFGLVLSFTDWNGISQTINFVGMSNYINVLTTSRFLTILGNTFYLMVLFIPIMNILAVILAAMVTSLRGGLSGFFKSAIFYPNLLCLIVVGFVWRLILDFNDGLVNSTMRNLGLNFLVRDWLGDPGMVMNSITLVFIWSSVGYYLVIYSAGIMSIPEELYEAASIEGSGAFNSFRRITVPLLAPSFTINIVLSTTLVFSSFGLILSLTNGGPGYASQTLPLEVYDYAFVRYRNTQGLAAGMILALMVTILIVIELKFLLKREDVY